jgi:hypothetical protein
VRLWLINLNIEGKSLAGECLIELSIIDKPSFGGKNGATRGLYD